MADNKEGFDLGKSGDSAPGFDLNKEGNAKPEPKKGFDLGKSGEAPSEFNLGKGNSEKATVDSPNKEAAAKKKAQSAKPAPKAESKAPAKAKDAAAEKKVEPAKPAPKAKTSSTDTSSSKPAAEKKSKVPMLMLGLALLLVALYFLMPGGDNAEDFEATLGNEAIQTETLDESEVSGMDGESIQDELNSPESSAGERNSSSVTGSDTEESTVTSEDTDTDGGADMAAAGEESSSNTGSTETDSGGDIATAGEESSSNAGSTETDGGGDIATADDGETTSTRIEAIDKSSAKELVSILFTRNSSRVDFSGAQVDGIRSYLSENPNSNLVIEGHASSEGDRFYNIGLSRSRAQAVKDELVRNGLDADRLEVVAQGSKYPVADNSTESGRAQNRRVELKFN